jgi:hypothetical protein
MAVVHDRFTALFIEFGLAVSLLIGVIYFLLNAFRRNHGDGARPRDPRF